MRRRARPGDPGRAFGVVETWVEEMDGDELLWLAMTGLASERARASKELRRREEEAREAAAERRRWN